MDLVFNTLFRSGLPVHEKVYEIVGGVTVVTSPGNIIKEPPGALKKPEIHVPVAHPWLGIILLG